MAVNSDSKDNETKRLSNKYIFEEALIAGLILGYLVAAYLHGGQL